MVLGPRHATAFRAFGDRAIVAGYATAPCPAMPNGDRDLAQGRIRHRGRTLARTCPRTRRGLPSRDVAASAARPWPGWSWPGRLTLGLADGMRLRRPDDPGSPGL